MIEDGHRAPRGASVKSGKAAAAVNTITSHFTSNLVNTVTAGNTASFTALWLSPALYGFEDPAAVIVKNYQEYRVKDIEYQWNPSLGSSTRGLVFMCFIDNPEIMEKLLRSQYTLSQIGAICKSTADSVQGPVWMPLRFRPRAISRPRRTKFSVNSDLPASGPTPPGPMSAFEVYAVRNELDLQVQGVMIAYVEINQPAGLSDVSYGSFSIRHSTQAMNVVSHALTLH